jgi:hypothetical protein
VGGQSYEALAERVRALSGVQVRELGQIGEYPIFALEQGSDSQRPTALVMGGTHGDEPAGPAAVLEFCRQEAGPWLEAFNFLAIPCPTGTRRAPATMPRVWTSTGRTSGTKCPKSR